MSQNNNTHDETQNEKPAMISPGKVAIISVVLTIVAFGAIVQLEPYVSQSMWIPILGIALFGVGIYSFYNIFNTLALAVMASMEMQKSNGESDGTRINLQKK